MTYKADNPEWLMLETLREVRSEITRVNKLAGQTTFNPYITDLVDEAIEALSCEKETA